MQLADFKNKWKEEQVRQAAEAERRRAEEERRRREEERARERRLAEEREHQKRMEYRRKYGIWPCSVCKGEGRCWYFSAAGKEKVTCPNCNGRGGSDIF